MTERQAFLEVEFQNSRMPAHVEYLKTIVNLFKKDDHVKPVISGKVFGENKIYTYIHHNYNPAYMLWYCRSLLPETKHFIECYQASRIDDDLITSLYKEHYNKALYFAHVSAKSPLMKIDAPEALREKIKQITDFEVPWVSKVRHPDQTNIMFLAATLDQSWAIDKCKTEIDDSIDAINSRFVFISKLGHHKHHDANNKEKIKFIRKEIPEHIKEQYDPTGNIDITKD